VCEIAGGMISRAPARQSAWRPVSVAFLDHTAASPAADYRSGIKYEHNDAKPSSRRPANDGLARPNGVQRRHRDTRSPIGRT
jgi:hypothetical protein